MWNLLPREALLVHLGILAFLGLHLSAGTPPGSGSVLAAEPASAHPLSSLEKEPLSSPDQPLTLDQALALASNHHPRLAAASQEVRAREAAVRQAGALPNPVFEVEIENFGGQGTFGGTRAAESTLLLGQLVELGGKRAKRSRLAAHRKKLAGWMYEAQRREILNGVKQAFVAVLAAQEKRRLQEELVGLSRQVREAVAARVEAGRVSPLESTKAEVALSSAEMDLNQAEQRLRVARIGLASFWGAASARFGRIAGTLSEPETLPSLETLTPLIGETPGVAWWETFRNGRHAELALAKSQRFPDITIRGGIRKLEAGNEETFVFGVSVPLPIFNRHRGNIRCARFLEMKAESEGKAARIEAEATLAQTYQELEAVRSRVGTIRDRVLSGAKRTYDGMNEGFREGKFGFLDVLDAQRTLFEAKAQYIDALEASNQLAIELERLLGRDLASIGPETTGEDRHEKE